MCGFVAVLGRQKNSRELKSMAQAVARRGPDDQGEYMSSAFSAIHHRLAIIGTDRRGRQPMTLGAMTVVFNGCIYNYPALRKQLEKDGAQFFSDSDTEVLIHLYRRFGVSMFAMLQGMFAIVLWDSEQNLCVVGRDAFGEKPLFVCEQDGRVGFASVLSAFELGDWHLMPDINSVRDVLVKMRVEAPNTMYQEVSQLPAGCYAVVRAGEAMAIRRYFFLPDAEPGLDMSPTEVQAEVHRLLQESFKIRTISDKPLGVFLSGGVDSSLIAAILAQNSGQKLHTLSVRFSGGTDDYDESACAAQVAKQLGTDHHCLDVCADAHQSLDDLALAFDQPVGNSAALPTYLISQAAKPLVDVALSGIGGDELFGGYPRYLGMAWHQRLQSLPGRGFLLSGLKALGDSDSSRNLPGRLRRFLEGLDMPAAQAYQQWTSTTQASWAEMFTCDVQTRKPGGWQSAAGAYGGLEALLQRYGPVNGAMAYDVQTYLNDDLLAVGDRMSMAHGLELRAPFLDTRLWGLLSQLDASYKLKGMPWQEDLKVLLKKIAGQYLPKQVVYRPKQGFMAPIKHWLRDELAADVENLIARPALAGLVRNNFIKEQWQRHQRGQDRSDILWTLLLMDRWLKQRNWEFEGG